MQVIRQHHAYVELERPFMLHAADGRAKHRDNVGVVPHAMSKVRHHGEEVP